MRKIILLLIVVLSGIGVVQAEETTGCPAGKKLTRGMINIVTAPVEIPKQARAYWIEGAQRTDHILVWIFSGSVTGTVEMAKRFTSGLWDVLSFSWEVPQGYEPLVKPEYVFEKWPRNPESGR